MLSLFPKDIKTVLCLGAHCDDIEIGCGATILRLAQEYPELAFYWVVLSSNARRAQEAKRSADLFLSGVKSKTVVVKEFRNGYFPYVGAAIKDYFEELKKDVQPDLVLTHHGHDYHQDHRLTSELTWNSFRDHLILEYEIVKYDGDLGRPNLFVPLSDETWRRKIDHILDCFDSQKDKRWFTRDTFQSLMRLRGVEANSTSGYAEAFYCRKLVI